MHKNADIKTITRSGAFNHDGGEVVTSTATAKVKRCRCCLLVHQETAGQYYQNHNILQSAISISKLQKQQVSDKDNKTKQHYNEALTNLQIIENISGRSRQMTQTWFSFQWKWKSVFFHILQLCCWLCQMQPICHLEIPPWEHVWPWHWWWVDRGEHRLQWQKIKSKLYRPIHIQTQHNM